MTHQFRRSFSARALSLAIATTFVNIGGFAILLGASDAAGAAEPSSPACPSISNEQQRLLEAATGGIDALRNHLWMRRGIRSYDLVETVRWIDSVRESSAACAWGGDRMPIARAEPDPAAPVSDVH